MEAISFSELINKRFSIVIGSSTESGVWQENDLLDRLTKSLTHNLFDYDFYYNWTNKREEYFKLFTSLTIKPMIENVNETLNKYFTFKTLRHETTLTFNNKYSQLWIDEWFKEHQSIAKELKNDYYEYRKQYAGVILN